MLSVYYNTGFSFGVRDFYTVLASLVFLTAEFPKAFHKIYNKFTLFIHV